MVYDTYNENSMLSPNQAVQGRDSNLYRNEDVPVLPRRYHEKLRDGEEGLNNKKRLYPPDQFPDLYKDEEATGTEADAGVTTASVTPEDDEDEE